MDNFKQRIKKELAEIQSLGLYKKERIIDSQQSSEILVNNENVLNFCANNYLGLSSDPRLIRSAQSGLEKWGFGLSSVRFIWGAQTIHKELENKLSSFLQMDDTILYSSCYDANGGLFETILNSEDVIFSDQLNHASIIDGVKLSKAKRLRYNHSDIKQLETLLIKNQNARTRLITTDGVFSMDGSVARLKDICNLASKYDALVHVDDSHATGFFGPTGRGSIEYCNVMSEVDIVTSTLGKALGGASGGFTSGRREIIDLLRQRSRPYLFSNTLAPVIVATSLAVLDIIADSSVMLNKIEENTHYFRSEIEKAGFTIKNGVHPIVPIMIGDAKISQESAREILKEGIYVIGFFFPVVPRNESRIRVQISAAHSKKQIDYAIKAFSKVGKKLKII